MKILRNIEWELDEGAFFAAHAIEAPDLVREARRFLAAAVPLLVPKAVYDEVPVEVSGDKTVTVGSAVFESAKLRKNLAGIHRVFAFIVTCGGELEGMDLSGFDVLASYWLDQVKEKALRSASAKLRALIASESGFGKLSSMNPGSGNADVWPIQQQKQLFSLFPNVTEEIGVRLTSSFLMVPNKSVSGLLFPAEVSYENCMVCTRANCPNRRAPFAEEHAVPMG